MAIPEPTMAAVATAVLFVTFYIVLQWWWGRQRQKGYELQQAEGVLNDHDRESAPGGVWLRQSVDENGEMKPSETRPRLTFVSHAGENKSFVKSLLKELNETNVATFFDDDMAMGTPAEHEMANRAMEADEAIVVLSRPFLTKEWPMKELNIFLKNRVDIFPLFYKVNPDDLWEILEIYDREAKRYSSSFECAMVRRKRVWRKLMLKIGGPTRDARSTSLPDPLFWREGVQALTGATGLRREEYGNDETSYVKVVARLASPPRLPDSLLPLPDHFVKPPLVDEVTKELLHFPDSEAKPRGVVVTGMGGTGKSLASSAVARDKVIKRHFRDGVLWLDDKPGDFNGRWLLGQLSTLAKQFRELVLVRHYQQGRVLQHDRGDFQDSADAKGFFSMCQRKYNLRCLLILDGVRHAEMLRDAGTMGFLILATSREADVVPTSPDWRSIPVRPMEEDASLLILERCSGADHSLPREPALQVAKDCLFLPLALAIAGSTHPVASTPLSVDAWRQLHQEISKNRATMLQNTGAEQDSLRSVLSVSFNSLGKEQRDQFMALAVVAQGVLAPKEMLRHLWGKHDLVDTKVAANSLVVRSLLYERYDQYFVHDLMLDFAKFKIEGFGEDIKEVSISRQAQYLGRVDVVWGYFDKHDMFGGLYSLIGLWLSLEDLSGDRALEVNTYDDSVRGLEQTKDSLDLAKIFEALGRLFYLQGKYTEARPLFERSYAILVTVLDPGDSAVATALNHLAELARTQGQYDEADEFYERALRIDEEVFGQNDERVPRDLNNRATLLESQGMYAKAEPLCAQAINVWKNCVGVDHPFVATALNNMAAILDRQGKYDEADQLYKDALEIDEKVFGPDHPHVARDFNNRARLMENQAIIEFDILETSKYEEAESLYIKAIEIGEKALGPEHPKLAVWLSNQASMWRTQGKLGKALDVLRRSFAIDAKVLLPDHPRFSSSLNNKAALLRSLGKYDEIDDLYLQAIEIARGSLSPNHPALATMLNNRAELLRYQGKYNEAAPLYHEALEIDREALGPDHGNVGRDLNNQGELLRDQRKFAKAEPLYRRAAEIFESTLGHKHPLVATVLNNRAGCLEKQGRYDEADPLYVEALEIMGATVGEEHPNYAATINNRAALLKLQGKYEEAYPMYERARTIDEKCYGLDHVEVAMDLMNCAEMLYEQRMVSESIPLWERALRIMKNKLGDNHKRTLDTAHSLQAAYEVQDNSERETAAT